MSREQQLQELIALRELYPSSQPLEMPHTPSPPRMPSPQPVGPRWYHHNEMQSQPDPETPPAPATPTDQICEAQARRQEEERQRVEAQTRRREEVRRQQEAEARREDTRRQQEAEERQRAEARREDTRRQQEAEERQRAEERRRAEEQVDLSPHLDSDDSMVANLSPLYDSEDEDLTEEQQQRLQRRRWMRAEEARAREQEEEEAAARVREQETAAARMQQDAIAAAARVREREEAAATRAQATAAARRPPPPPALPPGTLSQAETIFRCFPHVQVMFKDLEKELSRTREYYLDILRRDYNQGEGNTDLSRLGERYWYAPSKKKPKGRYRGIEPKEHAVFAELERIGYHDYDGVVMLIRRAYYNHVVYTIDLTSRVQDVSDKTPELGPPASFKWMRPANEPPPKAHEDAWFFMIKYDGCRALWDGYNQKLYTKNLMRRMGPIDLPENIRACLPKSAVLDCELVVTVPNGLRGETDREAAIDVANKRGDYARHWPNVVIYAFDVPTVDAFFGHRIRVLRHIMKSLPPSPHVKCAEGGYIDYRLPADGSDLRKELDRLCDKYAPLSEGFEGLVIKQLESVYKGVDHHTNLWFKHKNWLYTTVRVTKPEHWSDAYQRLVVQVADSKGHPRTLLRYSPLRATLLTASCIGTILVVKVIQPFNDMTSVGVYAPGAMQQFDPVRVLKGVADV